MAADGVLWIASIIFVIGLATVESSFQVPVFVWSKDSGLTYNKPVLAGHTISSKDFQDEYLQKLLQTPQIVALFLQDKLSVDDISQYGHPYGDAGENMPFANLRFALESAKSTAVLPEVDTDKSLLDFLKSNVNGKLLEVKSQELSSFDVHQYNLDEDQVNLFVFHLKPVSVSSPDSISKIFSENDKLLGSTMKQISSLNVPYTGLLTALDPSQGIYERRVAAIAAEAPHDRLRRATEEQPSLGADSSPKALEVNASGCILLYAEGLTLKMKNETYDLLNQTGLTIRSDPQCPSNGSSPASVKITLKSTTHTFILSMQFKSSKGMWSCSSLSFEFDNKKVGNMTLPALQAPRKMSYHCGDWKAIKKAKDQDKDEDEDDNIDVLAFKQLQVQPYDVEGKFSYAYDCVGFFTIPILMGLVTTGVFLVILFLGALALLSITTMDRFDDPKSAAISMGNIQE